MAHKIAMINGKPAMMYVGQRPWHELGTQFSTPPSTAGEVIKAAGLDWEVLKKPVYAFDGTHSCAIPGYQVTVREDLWGKEGCEPFGLVGEEYQVLQNREAFGFFDPIIQGGAISYETAGALGRGERVWVLARVHGDVAVREQDAVERFLLLSNGHNGRTALQVRFTPIRVVCQNTLACALSSGTDTLKAHHGRGMHRRMDEAQEQVKAILGDYDALIRQYERFAAFPLANDKQVNYFKLVFPTPKRKMNQTDRSFADAVARNDDLRGTGMRLFETGLGNDQPRIRGSLWAAYNGVTELVDHHLPYRDRWQRLDSIWFGEGYRIKQHAFDVASDFSRQ